MVLTKVFEKIEFYYNLLKRGDVNQINQIYFNHLMFSNEWKTYNSNKGKIEGKIIEVKENGLLVLKLRNKELMTFEFKELQFIF